VTIVQKYSAEQAVRREQVSMSQHEDSFQLEFKVVNAVTVNISDAARSKQTRQWIGISSGKRIREESSSEEVTQCITARLRL
jgi:hypothetical protein